MERKKIETTSGITIHCGDLGVRKLNLGDKTKPGTYQVVATSKSNFFTLYRDKKGKRKWVMKPMNKVKDAKKIIHSVNYKAFAKSFFSIEKWKGPEPLGWDLEIIPLTDLTDVHVGDIVQFEVKSKGKPFSSKPDKLEHLTATSNTFGGPDDFSLSAIIYRGKAQFRMPAAGQWVINVSTMKKITPEGAFKEFVGKCTKVGRASSISFNVKP